MDVTRQVGAPIEDVWRILTDTEHWTTWGPSVRGVEPPDATVVLGLRGRVRTPLGLWLPFEVTDVVARGPVRRWSWRVAGVPATGHRVEEREDGTCLVAFEIPGWAPAYALVCRAALRRIAALAER